MARDELASRQLEHFTQGDFLANGSFCNVLMCKDSISGKQYAMKMVDKKNGPADHAIAMEIHCLQRLKASPLVVSLLWQTHLPGQWIGVLEFCTGGELWAYVRHCGCCIDGEFAWFASQMVEALAVVHDAGITHRDVKCENFLITEEQRIKIIDFGTARDTQHPEVQVMLLGPQYEHHVGTPNFMSPEAINGRANDHNSDLWSLGCSFYQLITGSPPFEGTPTGMTPFLILAKAQKGLKWLPEKGMTPDERDLVQQLTHENPEKRLGNGNTKAVLKHKLFNSADGLRSPSQTRLARGLRCIGRAAADEMAVSLAADMAARESDYSEGAPSSRVSASDTGNALRQLPEKLQESLGRQSIAAGSAEDALLRLGIKAASMDNVVQSPKDFGRVVAELAEQGVGLPGTAKRRLWLFSELASQCEIEANADVDFGSENMEDEDEDEEETGKKPVRCCPSFR